MSLGSAIKIDADTLFSEALGTTPTTVSKIRKAWAAHAKSFGTIYSKRNTVFIESHLTNVNTQKFEIKQ
jgi:hypothetical protein